jgi:hypothetical protein
MARILWIFLSAAVLICATAPPAFACSCARVLSFEEKTQVAPIVVVGRVISVGEVPSQVDAGSNTTIVRPPFMGAGVILAIESVAKGDVAGKRARLWDLSFGQCFNALRGQRIGTALVVALWPVADTPAAERATWGAAAQLPETDYMTSGACGQVLQVLTAEQVAEWTGRKIQ